MSKPDRTDVGLHWSDQELACHSVRVAPKSFYVKTGQEDVEHVTNWDNLTKSTIIWVATVTKNSICLLVIFFFTKRCYFALLQSKFHFFVLTSFLEDPHSPPQIPSPEASIRRSLFLCSMTTSDVCASDLRQLVSSSTASAPPPFRSNASY